MYNGIKMVVVDSGYALRCVVIVTFFAFGKENSFKKLWGRIIRV